METIKKFLLNESLAQVTEEEDIDIKEKEIREIAGEGGPAMGGLGGDNIEPASPDANVIQEDVELEREAKLALTKDNTTLYGMTKAEARQILRDMGYSETGIKGIETYRQIRINSILKEEGMEFPDASRDQSLDNNMFDGSFYGQDKENLGDLQHGFDPNNPEMGALNQNVKPYESEFNNSPQEVMSHGPKGYKNSIPSYNNRTSSGFAEESYLPPGSEEGKAGAYNPTYPKKNLPPSRLTPDGEKGYRDSVDLPENLDHGLKLDLAKKDKDYETHEPGEADHDESMKDGSHLDRESVDMVKLIRLAVAKGYSKEAIKEMIKVLECGECGDETHMPDKKPAPSAKKKITDPAV